MAMVNMNNLLNGKDSRWLQLEVCREFQRNKCSRPDTECKFAHPPANVEVQNGRVTACYDSIKGRCNREKPPCKYFHPPQHLKDQLLINGRNHLALKNAIMQQMGLTPGQPLVPGQVPTVVDGATSLGLPLTLIPTMSLSLDEQCALMAANPYLTGMPQVGSTYSPYFAPGPIMPAIMGPDPSGVSQLGVVPQTVVTQQKMPRSDRLEMDVKSVGSFYYENFAFPGMMPYKRPAQDKSGMPVYQPSATTYQQLMQLQQPFVPVSCEYTSPPPPAVVTSLAMPSVSVSSPVTTLSAQEPSNKHLCLIPQQAAQQQQEDDDDEPPRSQSVVTSVTAPLPPLPPHPLPIQTQPAPPPHPHPLLHPLHHQQQHHDPAALAKEVAQQNYAKAVKLAAVSNSYGINSLTAFSYTGVALNKQAMSMPPPTAVPRYSTLPFNFTGAHGGLSLGLPNPYAQAHAHQQAAAAAAHAAQSQQNLLAFSRPPPTLINPYSQLLRPYSPAPQHLINQGLFTHAGQYPVAVSQAVAMPQPSVSLAQANNNNNNVTLQPYKKMKTT